MIRKDDPKLADDLEAFITKHPELQVEYFAVSPEQYRVIINNQTELLRYLRDITVVVAYYRKLK